MISDRDLKPNFLSHSPFRNSAFRILSHGTFLIICGLELSPTDDDGCKGPFFLELRDCSSFLLSVLFKRRIRIWMMSFTQRLEEIFPHSSLHISSFISLSVGNFLIYGDGWTVPSNYCLLPMMVARSHFIPFPN